MLNKSFLQTEVPLGVIITQSSKIQYWKKQCCDHGKNKSYIQLTDDAP